MTESGGRVVREVEQAHVCRPGWTYEISDGEGLCAVPKGLSVGHPPTPWDYPPGTVWACDYCDRTWVSRGSPAVNMPGVCAWRREGRFERWRREWRRRG